MTIRRSALLLAATAALGLSAGHAMALITSTASVLCSSTTRLQAQIDAVPAGTVATFNVSGTCNENIVVPQGKTIIINGAAAGARITPRNALLPALTSQGDTTLRRMILTNAGGTAEYLAGAVRGGQLDIVASDLRAPYVGSVVVSYIGSVRAVNSRVIGGNADAFELIGGSALVVKGDPLLPVGPTGRFESYVKSRGAGIMCARGGSFRVGIGTNAGAYGYVTIEQSDIGIRTMGCDFDLSNGGPKANIRIRNNLTGIKVERGTGEVTGATIANNVNAGIDVEQGQLSIAGSDITGSDTGLRVRQGTVSLSGALLNNVSADVVGEAMSSVQFLGEASSVPKAGGWSSSFICLSASRVDVDAGALSAAPGPAYDGCVFQQ